MKWCHLFFLLTASCLLGSPSGITYSFVEEPSFSYKNILARSYVHILEIDPSLYHIKPIKAFEKRLGRKTVLSIGEEHQAIAGINGGFFFTKDPWDGKPAGMLKINGWYGLPVKPRGCIGWSSSTFLPKLDVLEAKVNAFIEEVVFPVHGLNCSRKKGEIVLFTSYFDSTTHTSGEGEEVLIFDGKIISISQTQNTKIPEGGYILSIDKDHALYQTLQEGMDCTFSIQIFPWLDPFSSEKWENLEYLVGGAPLLLYEGNIIQDFSKEQTLTTFLHNKYARTAVGILPNGNWVFVVVDKRGFFDGMTIPELCLFMQKLGCIYALNLDGGGSSTMVYKGIVKNTPQREWEEGIYEDRKVSDAILVFPK